jgi:hypothetical protein
MSEPVTTAAATMRRKPRAASSVNEVFILILRQQGRAGG